MASNLKNTASTTFRAARLPFGDWLCFPRQQLNIVQLYPVSTACWRPVHLSIAITAQCHKGCDFCYAESNPQGTSHWKLQDILTLVASCDRNEVFSVTLGGGEPLLWCDRTAGADFYDLLQELSGHGCSISFTTSAVPRVDWARVPETILPRLSLHQVQDLARIVGEIERAREQGRTAPSVSILVRRGGVAETLLALEQMAEAGARDFLLLPLKAAGRASSSTLTPAKEELEELVAAFPCPNVKLSSCYHLEDRNDTYLGCGAGDWFVSLDEHQLLGACSFSKARVRLSGLDYRDILTAMPYLARPSCHTSIVIEGDDR